MVYARMIRSYSDKSVKDPSLPLVCANVVSISDASVSGEISAEVWARIRGEARSDCAGFSLVRG